MSINVIINKDSEFQQEVIEIHGLNESNKSISAVANEQLSHIESFNTPNLNLTGKIAYNSVTEFMTEVEMENTKKNLQMIQNKEIKLARLMTAVQIGDWNDPIFDLVNPDFIGIERGEYFEFPFLALYGLKEGLISYQEFYMILCYYGLRETSSKEEIQFHRIFNEDGTINPETEKLLKQCLCENLKVGNKILNFSDAEFRKFISILKTHNCLHELVLFSTPERDYTYFNNSFNGNMSTIWGSFRRIPISIFNNNTRQFTSSLLVLEIFYKNLYPHASGIKFQARIGFTSPESQLTRGQGYFDGLIPLPTCYPKLIDGPYPAPALEGNWHDTLGHAAYFCAIPDAWREKLYIRATQLRMFEVQYPLDNAAENKRHALTNFFIDLDNNMFAVFERNVLITNKDLMLRIDDYQGYLKMCAGLQNKIFVNEEYKKALRSQIDIIFIQWKKEVKQEIEAKQGFFRRKISQITSIFSH